MKHRKVLPHVFFAILVGVFILLNNSNFINDLFNSSQDNQILTEKATETGQVLRVIDGDTIEVSLNNKKETVRLIGIDAPETVDPRKPAQCFGKEASDKTKEVLSGKTITLESDLTQSNRDKYGRLLRYVFINNISFNQLMISEGFAHEFTYANNPYKYQSVFIQAAKEARENNRGLWQKCGSV